MIKQLRSITVNLIAGANVATAIVMWLVGFADYANPIDHPTIANIGLAFPLFLAINLGFLIFWIIFKWRMIVIPIVGYAAAFVPLRIYLPINKETTPEPGAFKIVSYNVKGFYDGDGEDSFERVIVYLKESAADIVCLQEDMYGSRNAQPRFDSLFAHSSVDGVAKDGGNFIGIYSKFPIVKKERINYESAGNGSFAYFLNIKGDTVIVINNHFESTHLSLDERQRYKDMLKGEMQQDTARAESRRLLKRLGESSQIRAPQADSVHQYIERHCGYPIIVCGDFNDNPISYTRRIVAKGLTDCYVETGNGVGVSFNQKGFFVRIDNIFCSQHFVPYNCKVNNKIDASDHYPISCWLRKRPKQ